MEITEELSTEELEAVDEAADMIRNGLKPALAIWKASKNSGIDTGVIAKELGRRGGKKKS